LRKENSQDIAGKISGKQIKDKQLVEVARNQGLRKGIYIYLFQEKSLMKI